MKIFAQIVIIGKLNFTNDMLHQRGYISALIIKMMFVFVFQEKQTIAKCEISSDNLWELCACILEFQQKLKASVVKLDKK